MSDGHRLVQLMRQAGQTPQNEVADVVIGEVTSTSPIKIKVESRELTESFLILSPLCKENRITEENINIREDIPPVGKYDIVLWRGLQVGDKVLMLKAGRGQKYYVLQREEGVTI